MQYFVKITICSIELIMKGTEQELVEGCCRGDNTARKELYDAYAGRLLAVCMRYLSDRATAEDMLHDSFIKIFASLSKFTYRGEGSLRAWMERVTVNVVLEYLRRNKKNIISNVEDGDIPDIQDAPSDDVARVPYEVIMRYVQELPDGYRTVFNLFCIEGWSHREIADSLGINEKSSSSQLTRAKSILATKLKEYLKKMK